jgi:uncharacterized protein (TIGR03437 family)
VKRGSRFLGIAAGVVFSVSHASAYYYFNHYTSRNANPVPEKYDLNTLPNRTITFFINDAAAASISRSDLYPSALCAIRQAASVWNSVQSSALRVSFGGVAASGTPQNTPGADIEFDELDPLTLGFTFTNAPKNTFASGPSGSFVPLQRPLVHLNANLNSWTSGSDPSFTEGFFLTVVHEMGHALGLQHTWTSSVMSTEVTRATSLSSPLTADDIGGLSYLYPTGNFLQSTGSIAGRITFPNGQGIHLASVVAITPTGPAMSALTLPDGTFRIDGLPANQYMLYVHPVPPATGSQTAPGGLTLPVNPDGTSLPADGPFDTMFYTGGPGTFNASQGQFINVTPGSVAGNINLTLNRRSGYTIPAVTTYSYFNQTAVRPGYLNGGGTLVAAGAGLTANGSPTPGLSVSFLGGTPSLDPTVPNNGVQAYAGTYLALYLQATSTFGGTGPRDVIFSLPDDIYVLPAGLNLVQSPPPSISSVTPGVESNGARSLAVAGSSVGGFTQFYLDGVPAPLLRVDASGRAIVALPPGIAGSHPVVTAFNPDGQNSMFLQAGSQPTYTYDTGSAGTALVLPNTLQAGTVSMIEIDGSNGNFVDGITAVGVGSSDVQVLRTWVVAPNKIYANVQVAPGAAVTAATLTVMTGFQVITLPAAVQILGFNGQNPVLNPQLTNATPNLTGIYSGALVTLSGSNLSNSSITLGGQNAPIVSSGANQITFQIPTGLPVGANILKLSSGSYSVSIAVQIDPAPPGVVNVAGTDNVSISQYRPAKPGDLLNVLVSSLMGPGALPDPRQVHVSVAGVDHPAQSVTPQGSASQVRIVLSPAVAAGQAPLTVSAGGRSSLPYYLQVSR